MRAVGLVVLAITVSMGCDDGSSMTPPDLGDGSADLAASSDLAIEGDLAGVDLATEDIPPKPVSCSQFQVDFKKAICDRLDACGKVPVGGLANCQETQERPAQYDCDTEILKMRMVVDESRCINAINSMRCDGQDVYRVFVDACDQRLFIPKQPNGTDCAAGQECTSGYCAQPFVDAGTEPQAIGCPATCTAFKALNDSCTINDECNVAQALCDGATQKCVGRADVNQACGAAVLCKEGLLCAGQWLTGTGTCKTPVAAAQGAACDPFQSVTTPVPTCVAGSYCKVDYTAMPKTAACAAQLAANAVCDPQAVPVMGIGDSPCQDGLGCYATTADPTPRCRSYGAANDQCIIDNDCQVGLFCDTKAATPVCKVRSAAGATCDTDLQNCLDGVSLQTWNCVPKMGGGPAEGTCVGTKGFNDACTPGVEDAFCSTSFCNPGSSLCTVQCR